MEPRELPHLKVIEKTIQRKLTRTKLPSAQDSRQKKQDILFGKIVTAIKEGRVLDYQEFANDLIQEYGSVDVVAAALELMAGDSDHEADMEEIHLSAERPIYVKRLKEPRRDGGRGKGGHGKYNRNEERGGNRDGKYRKDGMKKDFGKKDFNKKDVFKKDAGKKEYSNKAGKHKTYSRDGKKSYKKNKSAE